MRTAVAALVALAVLAPAARAGDAPGQAPSAFLRNNPGYRERAGAFYEKEYLPGAAAALARSVNHRRLPEEAARRLLRAYIYDWLAAYIEGEGAVPAAEQVRLLRDLDARVREALCDDAAYERYLKWRLRSQGGDNPLAFLMPPLGP
jgi:hypothetical protein